MSVKAQVILYCTCGESIASMNYMVRQAKEYLKKLLCLMMRTELP